MSNHRTLKVWKDSRALVARIYRATSRFPHQEMFGLTRQMRRAAVSIPSNIAEGHGRWTRRDCKSFIYIARGSAFELDTQIYLAEDIGWLTPREAESLREAVGEIARMLNGLIRYYTLPDPKH
jgi:four helix bundle protein